MSAVEAYRACPTRRSRDDMAVVRRAICDVIGEDPPMTVRQVFYQLVSRGVIEKTEAQYQGTVIRLMTEMRLSGELPYRWVVDQSRRVRITRTFDCRYRLRRASPVEIRGLPTLPAGWQWFLAIWSPERATATAAPGRRLCLFIPSRENADTNLDEGAAQVIFEYAAASCPDFVSRMASTAETGHETRH